MVRQATIGMELNKERAVAADAAAVNASSKVEELAEELSQAQAALTQTADAAKRAQEELASAQEEHSLAGTSCAGQPLACWGRCRHRHCTLEGHI